MILADSDVLIDALRGQPAAAERIDRGLQAGVLATTAITAFELRSGAGSEKAAAAVDTLLAALTILPFDEAAADRAADVRRTLEAEGTPIGMADYLIAGVCLARSTPLLTRNRGHFERIQGLELADL